MSPCPTVHRTRAVVGGGEEAQGTPSRDGVRWARDEQRRASGGMDKWMDAQTEQHSILRWAFACLLHATARQAKVTNLQSAIAVDEDVSRLS